MTSLEAMFDIIYWLEAEIESVEDAVEKNAEIVEKLDDVIHNMHRASQVIDLSYEHQHHQVKISKAKDPSNTVVLMISLIKRKTWVGRRDSTKCSKLCPTTFIEAKSYNHELKLH